MRKAVWLAAGAASILLAAMPAAAQHSWRAAAPGRGRTAAAGPTFFVGRHRLGSGNCAARSRRCLGNRSGRGVGVIGYAYGGLIEDPESLRDQGFFADTGDSWAENGHAVYDYDRGYPYDWYRDPQPAADPGPRLAPRPMVRCEVDWVAGARGAPSPVRVCRGRR